MRKNEGKTLFIILNLIISIVAFSFLISLNSEIVSGLKNGDTQVIDGQTKVYNNGVWQPLNLVSNPQPNTLTPAATSIVGGTVAAKVYKSTVENAFEATLSDGSRLSIAKGTVFTRVEGTELYKATIGGTERTFTAGQYNDFLSKGFISKESLEGAPTSSIWPLGLSTGNLGWDYIIQGAIHGAIVFGVVQLLGNLLGLEKGVTNAISGGAAAGLFAGETTYGIVRGFMGKSVANANMWGFGVGIVVGLLVAQYLYTEESQETVNFECLPWEAPTKGENCEKCNTELYPCSEYRCKALGQACEIVNAGTKEERCVWVNPKDVNSPIIQPLKDALTRDHRYDPNNAIRPPDRGVKIVYSKSSDGCVKAFTPLEFGVMLNEPSQCKIDYNRTDTFDQMVYYLGDNFYRYNHTEQLSLPGPTQLEKNAPELKNDGTYNLYVRCKDKNGNENNDLFVFTFCVEKGPDVTPPEIVSTSIANGMPVQYGLNSTEIEVYVNEPSECKWSKSDIDYNEMENTMACSQNIWEMNNQMLYKCKTTLIGLQDRTANDFFFKCRDQPWLQVESPSDRNTNLQSYKFTLKGSQPLTISSTSPNGTISGNSNVVPVYLEVETDNGQNYGDAFCSYSLTQNEKDYIKMYETSTNKHRQRLDLSSGTYTYYIQCVDLGGNAARTSISFNVEVDTSAPVVSRVYKEGSKLKIITNEKSSCSYSNNQEKQCNFAIAEGTNMPYANSTEHFAEWASKTFYIKCQDNAGRQPLPNECSIVVNPKN
ncbi:MAG: hypothetical protein NT076_01770 [Candidatus Pacearchaeota archaeon]|nr:hypothetical protein [Candidatus Pacearchaeota archaeon]